MFDSDRVTADCDVSVEMRYNGMWAAQTQQLNWFIDCAVAQLCGIGCACRTGR